MESKNNQMLLIVSLSCLLFALSADATWFPRNFISFPPKPSPYLAPQLQPAPTLSPSRSRSPSPSPSRSPSPSPSPSPSRSPSPSPSRSPSPSPISLSPSPSASPAVWLSSSFVDPGLEIICDTTEYPLLCLSSIAPFFHGDTSDLVSILKLAINASSKYTNLALDETEHFAESPATEPSNVEHYKDCYGFYTDAMDNFRDAFEIIEEHPDMDKLKYSLDHAAKDYEHCEDQFAAMNGGPLAKYYDTLKQLVSNCQAIANLINRF